MNAGHADVPVFDSADHYLFLIDDEYKKNIGQQQLVCVNPDHDVWQPVSSVPLERLKGLAVRCVMRRQSELQSPSMRMKARVQNRG